MDQKSKVSKILGRYKDKVYVLCKVHFEYIGVYTVADILTWTTSTNQTTLNQINKPIEFQCIIWWILDMRPTNGGLSNRGDATDNTAGGKEDVLGKWETTFITLVMS